MRIHREGYIVIRITLFILLLLDFGLWLINPGMLWAWIITFFFLIVFLWVIYFFRIPRREPVIAEKAIIAPADGKIVAIEETFEEEYFKDKRLQVSIFMSPFNVHANTIPLDGKVELSTYHPGKYLVAWNPKSSTLNERHTNVIKHEKYGSVIVRQIAGIMARRIVNYCPKGREVKQTEELGFIKFGSRVDLLLPLDMNLQVKLNDKVRGRQSVIAHFSSKE